jgi:hypothetical protein
VLLGLCAISISHPLLTTLGRGATFFIAHDANAKDIVTFAMATYFGPPAALLLTVLLFRIISDKFARLILHAIVGLLAGIWLLGHLVNAPTPAATLAALCFAVFVALLYATRVSVQSYLHFFGMISPAVLIFFLGFSPARVLLETGEQVSGEGASQKVPVLVLVLDEMSVASMLTSQGGIDDKRLPNFARLAGISTWYQNATTVSTQTERAIPAIMTGMRVTAEEQPTYAQFPQNLFSVLAASHSVRADETVTRMCPVSVCDTAARAAPPKSKRSGLYTDAAIVFLHVVLPRQFADKNLPSIGNSWRGFDQIIEVDEAEPGQTGFKKAGGKKAAFDVQNTIVTDMARSQKERFNRFLDSFTATSNDKIRLDYFHLALPHVPWIYLPDGTLYNGNTVPGQKLIYAWGDNQDLVDQGILRYNLQVEYVDKLLGELLDRLEASNHLANTMLVVVSDHGVSFAANSERRVPVTSTLAGVAQIPLFIKYPEQTQAVRDDRPVETIDIFPTIADVLQVPLSTKPDGQSLVSTQLQAAERHIFEAKGVIEKFETALNLDEAIQRQATIVKRGRSALEAIVPEHLKSEDADSLRLKSSGANPSLSLRLDRPAMYHNVNLKSGFLPARLTAVLPGAPHGTPLLILLNESVAGSSTTFGAEGALSVILDPRLFVDGHNVISAYTQTGDEFHEVALESPFSNWTVLRDTDQRISSTQNGSRTWTSPKLHSPGLEGNARLVPYRGSLLKIKGRARGISNGDIAEKILLLRGDNVIATDFSRGNGNWMLKNLPEHKALFYMDIGPEPHNAAEQLSVIALFRSGHLLHLPLTPLSGN